MKRVGELKNLTGGISWRSKKVGPANSFAFGRSIDFRADSAQTTVLPRSTRLTTTADLGMAADIACDNLYFHGNTGNIYRIDANDATTLEYTVPNSIGNGLAYFPEDKYLYIFTNDSISRRSNACGDGDYFDNFLESEGGAPTNTAALRLVAASSQSATRADTASLSLTGDLTFEIYAKMNSLPTSGNTMSLLSKWDESGTLRSYKLDIIPTSAAFDDGSAGNVTISVSATETVIDANCNGTSGTNQLTLSNITGSFAIGQKVYIHQTRGAGAGQVQETEIVGIAGSVLTLADNLTFSPQHSATAAVAEKAQVRVIPRYADFTINSGINYSVKPWDGLKGGIMRFSVNGTFTRTGNIIGTGKGFRGGLGVRQAQSWNGESSNGASTQTTSANGTGGGGGKAVVWTGPSQFGHGGGAGGAYASNTSSGFGYGLNGDGGQGATATGAADLTTISLGNGGGGSGCDRSSGGVISDGGDGGAIIDIAAANMTGNGTIANNGESTASVNASDESGTAGAGSAGSTRIRTQVAALGSGVITATGGVAGLVNGSANGAGSGKGSDGSDGRIALTYYTSFTGTTTPTLYSAQDDNLGAANGYALRLYLSSTGLNSETYTMNIDNPQDFYKRWSITWDASASTASFYQNTTLLGTRVGTLTAIHDNATEFAIGCSKNGAGTRANFADMLVDDVRVFSSVRNASEISIYQNRILTGVETGLVAYYKFDNDLTDSQTAGLNDLTGNNTPTYTTDVAFKGVTTRADEDVFIDGSGQTYTLTTSLNEGATHRQTFIPTKEPLKSIAFNIDTVGTGNWTVVIHDALNNEIASVTVATANLTTGIYEFILTDSVRPVRNASYHVHVYSTVADGEIVTGTISDMETAYLKTYFQILVDDDYHPAIQFANFLAVGNERYLAILEAGNLYTPHRIVLPSGYRIRSLAPWGEYLAIGTWKGETVTDTDQGKVFFWDGTSDTYVEPLEIPQGAVNAMFGSQRKLTIVAGYEGKTLEYTGGSSAKTAFEIPLRARTDYVEIAPNAITMWRGMIRLGSSFNTNSETIHQGIYTWGREDESQAMSLGFDYPLSLGDTTSNMVKTGVLITRGRKLYATYQNANNYAIDIIDVDAEPYPTATVELLVSDLNALSSEKLPLIFRADFEPLTSGQSIALKWKPNRAVDWVPLKTMATAGATNVRGAVDYRIQEAQFACDIVSTSTAPVVTGFTLESDDERNSRKA